MTIEQFNALPDAAALDTLLACCASREWATQMLRERPYQRVDALIDNADRSWLRLSEPDWLEAFAAHPRIGQMTTAPVSKREQAQALSAGDDVRIALAQGNAEYERKFGFIYIVFATGKSAEQMLELLRVRLTNDRDTEMRNAVAEQMKITRLRLQRLLEVENLKT